jgi:hypothetical protein
MTNPILEKQLEEVSILLEEEIKKFKKADFNMKGKADYRTICSVLRDIYNNTEDERLKDWAIEATIIAKKMTKAMVKNKIDRSNI